MQYGHYVTNSLSDLTHRPPNASDISDDVQLDERTGAITSKEVDKFNDVILAIRITPDDTRSFEDINEDLNATYAPNHNFLLEIGSIAAEVAIKSDYELHQIFTNKLLYLLAKYIYLIDSMLPAHDQMFKTNPDAFHTNDDDGFLFDIIDCFGELHKKTEKHQGRYFFKVAPGTQCDKLDKENQNRWKKYSNPCIFSNLYNYAFLQKILHGQKISKDLQSDVLTRLREEANADQQYCFIECVCETIKEQALILKYTALLVHSSSQASQEAPSHSPSVASEFSREEDKGADTAESIKSFRQVDDRSASDHIIPDEMGHEHENHSEDALDKLVSDVNDRFEAGEIRIQSVEQQISIIHKQGSEKSSTKIQEIALSLAQLQQRAPQPASTLNQQLTRLNASSKTATEDITNCKKEIANFANELNELSSDQSSTMLKCKETIANLSARLESTLTKIETLESESKERKRVDDEKINTLEANQNKLSAELQDLKSSIVTHPDVSNSQIIEKDETVSHSSNANIDIDKDNQQEKSIVDVFFSFLTKILSDKY